MVVSPAQLDKLIEEGTVDCNNDAEQVSGLFTMIEEDLALPFAARVLGVEGSVVDTESVPIGAPESTSQAIPPPE